MILKICVKTMSFVTCLGLGFLFFIKYSRSLLLPVTPRVLAALSPYMG